MSSLGATASFTSDLCNQFINFCYEFVCLTVFVDVGITGGGLWPRQRMLPGGEFLLPWLERVSGCLQHAGHTDNADLWPSNAEAASASSLENQLRYCRTQPGAHAWPPCRAAAAALLRVECSKSASQVGQQVVFCGHFISGGQGCSFWGEAQAEASSSVLLAP